MKTNGKYQCGSCEQFFSEPKDGECPHCGSGNYVEGCIDDTCEQCKKLGENTCGNDMQCRCFEPKN